MSFLEIRQLSHAYGTTAVLSDIDLGVQEGELVVLVGPSGCGKSTLLNLVAGLERVQSGDIALGGVSIVDRPPAERDIAMVFQSYALYPHMTVRDNLGFGLKMRGVAPGPRAAAILEVAELLKITELLDRRPRELSGGQRQRVAMGRALVRKPNLFLFDEPLSNLDAQLRVEMRALIKRLHQRFKTTTVYVTHDQVEAMTLATRLVVMDRGRVQQVGTPEEVYLRPANLRVARLIGSPTMNLLAATLVSAGGRIGARILQDGGGFVELPLPGLAALDTYSRPDVVLGLRPEAFSLVAGGETNGVIAARVELVEPTGADTFVVFKVGPADVIARLPASAAVHAGDTVRFAINMASCVLFDPMTETRLGAT